MSVKFSLLCARRVYEYVVVRGRCVTAVRRNHSRYSMNSMCWRCGTSCILHSLIVRQIRYDRLYGPSPTPANSNLFNQKHQFRFFLSFLHSFTSFNCASQLRCKRTFSPRIVANDLYNRKFCSFTNVKLSHTFADTFTVNCFNLFELSFSGLNWKSTKSCGLAIWIGKFLSVS